MSGAVAGNVLKMQTAGASAKRKGDSDGNEKKTSDSTPSLPLPVSKVTLTLFSHVVSMRVTSTDLPKLLQKLNCMYVWLQTYCDYNPLFCFAFESRGKGKQNLALHMKNMHNVETVHVDKQTREARCSMLPWDYFVVVKADDELFLVCRDFQRFLGDIFYCASFAKCNWTYTMKVKDQQKDKWYAMGQVLAQMVKLGDGKSAMDRLLVPHLFRTDDESKRRRIANPYGDESTNPATAFDVLLTFDPPTTNCSAIV